MSLRLTMTRAIGTALSITLIAGTVLPVSSASAHDRHKRGWNGHSSHYQHDYRRYKKRKQRNNNGDLIAAGIIGLTLGAIIASETAKRRDADLYQRRQPYGSGYYPETGGYYGGAGTHIPMNEYPSSGDVQRGNGPEVITYNDPVSYEPWTPAWRDWCDRHYRSFNPETGTYRGYDGLNHFCVPK